MSALAPLLDRFRTRSTLGWIGVDVGSHSVKLTQLENVRGRRRITAAAVIPVSEFGGCNLDTLRGGGFSEALRRSLAQHGGFTGRDAACAVSMHQTAFQSMTLPPGSADERRGMIAQELTTDGLLFDFWDGDGEEASDGGKLVNVLSVSEELVTELAQALARAGLACHVVDGGPFPMARALRLAAEPTETDQPVAVLDWGHRTAHYAIVVKGQPVFSRLLKGCGLGGMIAAIQKSLGLSLEDCHELLGTIGVSGPKSRASEQAEIQAMIDDLATATVGELLQELKKTQGYLKSQRSAWSPAETWLVGGGAAIRHMAERLTRDAGGPVHTWRPMLGPTLGFLSEGRSMEVFAQAAALSELRWQT